MKRILPFFILLAFCNTALPLSADASPFVATAYQAINVFDGPGITYLQNAHIEADVPFNLVERNSVGTWVHIQRARDDGRLIYDGWVISGYLNLDPRPAIQRRAGQYDAGGCCAGERSVRRCANSMPCRSSRRSATRCAKSTCTGATNCAITATSITKVGDSMTADDLYLKPMSQRQQRLGAV